MPRRLRLPYVPQEKLLSTYDIIYELQHRLGISDESLLNTSRSGAEGREYHNGLRELKKSYENARDSLITWYLRQTKVELNVTISLLTAKIKFIEYKLGECNGLDLHQACSLSLVDFCNILADMTILNKDPAERKTMRTVSNEAGIPVWLSHYRNQICHVPSESPCISILVPLVAKALDYMRESFWDAAFVRDSFDPQKCRNLFRYLTAQSHVTSVNQQLQLKKGFELSKKRQKALKGDMTKISKACCILRKILLRRPKEAVDFLASLLLPMYSAGEEKNVGLVIEQILLTKKFELLVLNLVYRFQNAADENLVLWLKRIMNIVGYARRPIIKKHLQLFNICPSNKIIRSIDIPPVKCCRIAYLLVRINHPSVRVMIVKLRHKLSPILGKSRVALLTTISRIAIEKSIACAQSDEKYCVER